MALTSEQQGRIELLVGIDHTSYEKTKTQLKALFRDRVRLGMEADKYAPIEKIADKVREAIKSGGKELDAKLVERFDKTTANLMTEWASVAEQMAQTAASTSLSDTEKEERYSDFLRQRDLLVEKMEAEVEAHKLRAESAKKLSEALKPDMAKFKDVSELVGSGFLDTINKAKAGDLAGFMEGVTSATVRGLSSGSELLGTASKGTASAAVAADLGLLATTAAGLASAFAVVGGSIAAIIALLVAADEQAKKLNREILEGAAAADFAYGNRAGGVNQMVSTLDSARKAALDLAFEYRGEAEEFTGLIAQLNQAGLSYREMVDASGSYLSETEAIVRTTREAVNWANQLGISTGEAAEAMASWSTDFGADLEGMKERFASISKFAQEGGFNTKRFFTAVSQATAGMAIYNIRMEEAAFLLAKTQKILGGTDASEFIQSLTKGFADESMTDRMKRVMIAGQADTQRIFAGTADRAAEAFSKNFGDNEKVRGAISDAFAGAKIEFATNDLTDPGLLMKKWGQIDERGRRLVIAQLRKNGDEQAQAAAQQLETLGRSVDAANGGLAAQTKGLAALDMQGKLAFKLQTLGDKRLNDMSIEELAAFENYAGISGAQLEQLMRVESQLLADYELRKASDKTFKMGFTEWVATNKDAQVKQEELSAIMSDADARTQAMVENTRSVFSVLSNVIAVVLNDIYGLMNEWFGKSQELSQKALDNQTVAMDEVRRQRDEQAKRLSEIGDKIAAEEETIRTRGKDDPKRIAAEARRKELEAEKAKARAGMDYLSEQERVIRSMDGAVLEALTASQVVATSRSELTRTKKDLDIAARHLSSEEMDKLVAERDAARREAAPRLTNMEGQGYTGKGATFAAGVLEVGSMGVLRGPIEEFIDGTRAQTKVMTDALFGEKRVAQQEQKFRDEYQKTTTEALFDALQQQEGWKLATGAGLEGDDLAAAIAEWTSGETAAGRGKLAAALAAKGYDPFAEMGGSTPMAPDFVMRPGQPAQRFNPSDTIIGMKAGGPLASAGAGGGVVNITINGGDQAAVYRTVKDALKNAGLRS